MAKSKKSSRNKSKNRLKKTTNQTTSSNHHSTPYSINLSDSRSVYIDLISIDDNRRLRACRLLSSVLGLNSNNDDMINKMMANDTLPRLVLRLIDTNDDVRYEAIGALRNLALCNIEHVADKIINNGAIDALLSQAHTITHLLLQNKPQFCIQYIACLSNLIASDDNIAVKCSNLLRNTDLISTLITYLPTLVNISVVTYNLLTAIFDLLMIITDEMDIVCNYLVPSLPLFLTHIHAYVTNTSISGISGGSNMASVQPILFQSFDHESMTIHVKCVGVVFNILQAMKETEAMSILTTTLTEGSNNSLPGCTTPIPVLQSFLALVIQRLNYTSQIASVNPEYLTPRATSTIQQQHPQTVEHALTANAAGKILH